ncbi:VgrG protein [Minicystis rosea]|nr:VgrG protein [Minicystis rosea]
MYRALIQSPVFDGPQEITALHGVEALGELFEYRITVPLLDPGALRGNEAALLQSPIALLFEEDGTIVSEVHGIASEIRVRVTPNQRTGAVHVTLVPRAWVMTRTRATQIFLDRSIPEIITEKLAAAGLAVGVDVVLALRERYPVREFVAQYQESDYAFIARLCEHVGITLFFRHDTGRDVIVFTDTQESYEPMEAQGGVIHYHPEDDFRAALEVSETFRRVPERVHLHDYNYRMPQMDLSAGRGTTHDLAHGAVVEYAPHAKLPEEIDAIARVRAEEAAVPHHVVEARTRQLALRAGATFTLVDAASAEHRLLVTRLVTRSHPDGATAREERWWHNEVTAIPAQIPFRPARITPRPRVDGLLHAVIDGAVRGPYAEVDEQGRYRVRFRYDLAGRPDMKSTHPIRMMQPHAGTRYGMHFPLRAGTEVLVGFVEGDPDRPLIVGAVPNPITPSPVELANATQNVLRTGSGNEMVIDDTVGEERVRIHTPKENTTLQLGAVEEPEVGALLVTDANITEAARVSINESTMRKTTIAETSASLVGDTAVLVAGLPAIGRAVMTGMQDLGSVSAQQEAIAVELARLGRPAGEYEDGDDEDGSAFQSLGSPLWSDLGASLTDAARAACLAAVRSAAEAADTRRLDSKGRREGEPLGEPGTPAAVIASPETAALVSRSRTLVYGERASVLVAYDTASVIGGETAELKSPATVEVAGGEEVLLTSAGTMDLAAKRFRLVAGYYPEKEAPELDDGTSVGIMGRRDIRLTSIEHCIHVCAHKDLIAAAHTGSMRMKAQKQVSIQGGSVSVSGGWVGINSGGDVIVKAGANIQAAAGADVSIEAGGTATIKGATVIIEGGTITLNGPVTVNGDLTVTGALNGG